ncbi:hypothetical protein RFI_13185, partial [Reticulomyxa filosa]
MDTVQLFQKCFVKYQLGYELINTLQIFVKKIGYSKLMFSNLHYQPKQTTVQETVQDTIPETIQDSDSSHFPSDLNDFSYLRWEEKDKNGHGNGATSRSEEKQEVVLTSDERQQEKAGLEQQQQQQQIVADEESEVEAVTDIVMIMDPDGRTQNQQYEVKYKNGRVLDYSENSFLEMHPKEFYKLQKFKQSRSQCIGVNTYEAQDPHRQRQRQQKGRGGIQKTSIHNKNE